MFNWLLVYNSINGALSSLGQSNPEDCSRTLFSSPLQLIFQEDKRSAVVPSEPQKVISVNQHTLISDIARTLRCISKTTGDNKTFFCRCSIE